MTSPDQSPCAQMGVYPSSLASRLPPELLVNIFEYLVTHSSPAILLRICRRWADIASSVSSLWTRIDFSTPPAPFLQRSLDLPIEVNLSSPVMQQVSVAREVLSLHHDRIHKLGLNLSARLLREIGPELEDIFPILEDVTISAVHGSSNHSPAFPEWTPFASPSPIQYLRLLLVSTPWVPGRFQNLVEFFLHDQWYISSDPPMEIFLDILESSPQLTVLSVANAGPRSRSHTTTIPLASRTVHLRNLQQLYLEQEDVCDVGGILVHLSIPVSANVRIFVDLSGDNEMATDPLEDVFDLALPDHYWLPHLTNPHRCTYAVDNQPSCLITAPNFAFRVIWDEDRETHCEYFMLPFLRRVAAAGVLEDLSTIFDVDTRYNISQSLWNEAFGTLGSLRKLRVKQLQDDGAFPIRGLLESQLCPTLQDLELSSIVFGEKPEEEGLGDPLVEKLVDCCAEQGRRGHRLQRLIIEAPTNAPPDLALLLAPHVDYVEIRGDVSRGGGVGKLEFGSRQVFDSLRTCRHDTF